MANDPRGRMEKLRTRTDVRNKASHRVRVRSLAGVPVENVHGEELPYVDGDEGWQWLEFAGVAALFELIEFWGVPVTIAPPEGGVEFWTLELEEGGHHEFPSILDEDAYDPLVTRAEEIEA